MTESYLDLFAQGGTIMVILLFISIGSLAIILERIVVILKRKTKLKNLFDKFDSSPEEFYSSVEDNFKKRTHVLLFIVQLAPLLGILGTVLGLSESFLSIGSLGGSEKFQLLAIGVGKALSTTIAGLIISAYTMTGHYIIKYLISKNMLLVKDMIENNSTKPDENEN